jgi:fructoselysine 6-kinase
MGVVAIGDNVVDCYLDSGDLYPGGNCVNVAVAARRSGVPAAYIGAIGTDDAGDLLRKSMVAEDIDLARLRVVTGSNAYATVRHVDQDRVFGPRDVGVRVFVPDAVDFDYLSNFEVAHSSYCSFLEEYLPQMAARTRLSSTSTTGIRPDTPTICFPTRGWPPSRPPRCRRPRQRTWPGGHTPTAPSSSS